MSPGAVQRLAAATVCHALRKYDDAIQLVAARIGRVTGRGLAANMGDVLPREHSPQRPEGWQAGTPACPTQPASSAQGRQVRAMRSHAGPATTPSSA